MATFAATSAAVAVAVTAALAVPSTAGASTVTLHDDGSVIFRGQPGARANVQFSPKKKSSNGRSVLSVVTDAAAQTLAAKGRCKRGASPRVAICTARSSRRLRRFRVRLSDGSDRLRWANFTTIRNTRVRGVGRGGGRRARPAARRRPALRQRRQRQADRRARR